ncbi:hypothetical protein UC8_41100 [Roseimaritima ulvae]|uniref:Uncharacterized protein n=1 Tax=Roseimaritima ulvae TaxID=980254 RepID=A0A5B9QWB8_9BACT|nr:hypothetical protein UC8_41100 [Roseimaritima ulvae]
MNNAYLVKYRMRDGRRVSKLRIIAESIEAARVRFHSAMAGNGAERDQYRVISVAIAVRQPRPDFEKVF